MAHSTWMNFMALYTLYISRVSVFYSFTSFWVVISLCFRIVFISKFMIRLTSRAQPRFEPKVIFVFTKRSQKYAFVGYYYILRSDSHTLTIPQWFKIEFEKCLSLCVAFSILEIKWHNDSVSLKCWLRLELYLYIQYPVLSGVRFRFQSVSHGNVKVNEWSHTTKIAPQNQ